MIRWAYALKNTAWQNHATVQNGFCSVVVMSITWLLVIVPCCPLSPRIEKATCGRKAYCRMSHSSKNLVGPLVGQRMPGLCRCLVENRLVGSSSPCSLEIVKPCCLLVSFCRAGESLVGRNHHSCPSSRNIYERICSNDNNDDNNRRRRRRCKSRASFFPINFEIPKANCYGNFPTGRYLPEILPYLGISFSYTKTLEPTLVARLGSGSSR